MSGSYKKFSECGTFQGCNRLSLKGDSRIMNPLMMGLESPNPFKVKYNDMRVPPLVLTNDINYGKLNQAYPQKTIN